MSMNMLMRHFNFDMRCKNARPIYLRDFKVKIGDIEQADLSL